jgi:hypothetical protein
MATMRASKSTRRSSAMSSSPRERRSLTSTVRVLEGVRARELRAAQRRRRRGHVVPATAQPASQLLARLSIVVGQQDTAADHWAALAKPRAGCHRIVEFVRVGS